MILTLLALRMGIMDDEKEIDYELVEFFKLKLQREGKNESNSEWLIYRYKEVRKSYNLILLTHWGFTLFLTFGFTFFAVYQETTIWYIVGLISGAWGFLLMFSSTFDLTFSLIRAKIQACKILLWQSGIDVKKLKKL